MKFILPLIVSLSFKLSHAQDTLIGVLSIADNNHDFGYVMEDDGTVKHQFIVENTGASPLVITRVRTTCDCTSPLWTKAPIAPGEKGFVEVGFNPEGHNGAFHKTILIQSTAANSSMFVTVSGKVLPTIPKEDLRFYLGELKVKKNQVNLGYLYKGVTDTERIPMYNPTSETLELSFPDLPDHLTITSVPERIEPGTFGYIEIEYCTDKTDAWHIVIDSAQVQINDKKNSSETLTLVANIREDFRDLSPEELASAPMVSYDKEQVLFKNVTVDSTLHCSFTLSNKGQSDLVIRAIKPSCGCTIVQPEKLVLEPGESTKIQAAYDPTSRNGKVRNSIIVVTNAPNMSEKQLFIDAFVNIPRGQ